MLRMMLTAARNLASSDAMSSCVFGAGDWLRNGVKRWQHAHTLQNNRRTTTTGDLLWSAPERLRCALAASDFFLRGSAVNRRQERVLQRGGAAADRPS